MTAAILLRIALKRLPVPGELKGSKKFQQWAKQVARKPAPADPLALHRCGACSLPAFAFC